MKPIEFTEQEIVEGKNVFAPYDKRMLPKTGKGAEHRSGYCTRCGAKSWPYSLCKKHREHGSIKRQLDKLVDAGEIEKVADGRGRKGGTIYRNPNYKKPEPHVRQDCKTGRNEPCRCGSGKKFKKCCGST